MAQNKLAFSSALRTDIGKVRKLNEDSGLDRADSRLWGVADGMGGHSAGDLASQMIVNSLAKIKRTENLSEHVDFVEHSLLGVNNRLYELSVANDQIIGSTVVVMLAGESHCIVIWAGDSRLYRLRDGELKQLTTDHTQAEIYIEQGLITREDALGHPSVNMVTRAVGAGDVLHLDMDISEIKSGDRYLLCSDGLDKHVQDPEIAALMHSGTPTDIVDKLISLTLDRGASDNVTVCAINTE